jgi:hypothetical protein
MAGADEWRVSPVSSIRDHEAASRSLTRFLHQDEWGARPSGDGELSAVAEQIRRLRERLVDAEAQSPTEITAVDESILASAVKLAHHSSPCSALDVH